LNSLVELLNQQDIKGLVFVFCRVGTAFILLPGFSFARVPMMFRALLAFAVSAAAYPFLKLTTEQVILNSDIASVILNELFVGLFFGFLCALFVYAVRFFAHFIMALIGLAGIPGQSIDDLEPNPALVMILSMLFTAVVFALDLHLVSFGALLETYKIYPLGQQPDIGSVIDTIGNTLRDTSLMALQASSPFILYAIGINFALGLIGKLTPQLQAYFALMGASIIIAFLGLYIIGSPLLSYFVTSYADWLGSGL
jgi:flagellar biosynthesis protein FliR